MEQAFLLNKKEGYRTNLTTSFSYFLNNHAANLANIFKSSRKEFDICSIGGDFNAGRLSLNFIHCHFIIVS